MTKNDNEVDLLKELLEQVKEQREQARKNDDRLRRLEMAVFGSKDKKDDDN